MNGLLLVNKPVGVTSFDVIRRLRRVAGERKIGHAGTLDPLAEGLMLLLFGSATKQAADYSKLDKVYRGEITLGAESITGDREGKLMNTSSRRPSQPEVERVLQQFIGPQTQVPPQYSAVKVAGKEAYKYARKGQTVELPERRIQIHNLKLLNYHYPKIEFEAEVSSGTYIRSLAEDIGRALKTGGYLSNLARIQVGQYELGRAVELDIPADELAANLIAIDKIN